MDTDDDITTSVGAEAAHIADLECQIAELRHQPSGKPVGRKPDTFTSSRKNRVV
jgi:hypothetical protein